MSDYFLGFGSFASLFVAILFIIFLAYFIVLTIFLPFYVFGCYNKLKRLVLEAEFVLQRLCAIHDQLKEINTNTFVSAGKSEELVKNFNEKIGNAE